MCSSDLDDGPIHQVFGMKNRQARRRVETGSDEIEVVGDAHNVGIGVVGVKNRIAISAVAIVCDPNFRR